MSIPLQLVGPSKILGAGFLQPSAVDRDYVNGSRQKPVQKVGDALPTRSKRPNTSFLEAIVGLSRE
jgi:hypothetical protein